MLITNTIPFRRKRTAARTSSPTPPPAELVLTAASFDHDAERLSMTFDRPIDVAAIDGTQILVDDDAFTGNRYDGTGGATLLAPDTVRVQMIRIDSAHSSGVHLTASASTGIVAVDDGGTWPGVTDLPLSYT
jgi:hypothetical protein